MYVLRQIGLFLSKSALSILLFMLVASISLTLVLGEKEKVKDIVADSGAYDTAIDSLIVQLDKTDSREPQKNEEFDLSSPELQAAVERALPPEVIRVNLEKVIDGVYAWLEGDTSDIQFTIDLTEPKQRFIEEINTLAQKELSGLPPCSEPSASPSDIDPFTATCLPPSVSAQAAADRFTSELENNSDFLPETIITAEDVNSNDDELQPRSSEQLVTPPEVYGFATSAAVILGILTALTAAAVVLLSPERWQGLKAVGRILYVVAIMIFIGSVIAHFIVQNVLQSTAEGVIADVVIPLVKSFEQAVFMAQLWCSLILFGSGLAVFLFARTKTDSARQAIKPNPGRQNK